MTPSNCNTFRFRKISHHHLTCNCKWTNGRAVGWNRFGVAIAAILRKWWVHGAMASDKRPLPECGFAVDSTKKGVGQLWLGRVKWVKCRNATARWTMIKSMPGAVPIKVESRAKGKKVAWNSSGGRYCRVSLRKSMRIYENLWEYGIVVWSNFNETCLITNNILNQFFKKNNLSVSPKIGISTAKNTKMVTPIK